MIHLTPTRWHTYQIGETPSLYPERGLILLQVRKDHIGWKRRAVHSHGGVRRAYQLGRLPRCQGEKMYFIACCLAADMLKRGIK